MTYTERQLQKMTTYKTDFLLADIKAIQSNLKAKDWVLSQKQKLKPEKVQELEGKYQHDYKKYITSVLIYLVVKHVEDDDLKNRIFTIHALDRLRLSIEEELNGTVVYKKIMAEYELMTNIPELQNYYKYFGDK